MSDGIRDMERGGAILQPRKTSRSERTMADRNRIYEAIETERQQQDAQWGGPEYDDLHGAADWMGYRRKFEERVIRGIMVTRMDNPVLVRARRDALIKIAALAVAQIESLDRLHNG